MIYFDTTNAASWGHASGLATVSRRLLAELGASATGATWPRIGTLAVKGDWVLSAELFSEHERPGLTAFLGKRSCRAAAIYHDAIPIKHPAITWPKSVERHPSYMKLLAGFDRVWAVSAASRDELLAFWKWQGIKNPPPVDVLALGADGAGTPRATAVATPIMPPRIVSVGILEPRKNQMLLLDASDALRREGVEFELHLVGRINPHFGRPIARRVERMRAERPGVAHHASLDDAALSDLLRSARATAFPSIAEGCGLPLLESLWAGVPCICSDIPPLLENAAGGGCSVVEGNSLEGWKAALRRMLSDDAFHARIAKEALARTLPTWAGAAATLRNALV